MKKIIVTAVLGVILSTSVVAEAQKFRFEFLNEQGTEALGVGHGHFDPDTTDTITIQPTSGDNVQFDTKLKLTQIGITVNGTNGSAGYKHDGLGNLDDDLWDDTWLNTDEDPAAGAGYSDGTVRTDGKWRFGAKDNRKLELDFSEHTWEQDTMEIQPGGEEAVRVTSKGLFRSRMVESGEELDGLLETVIDEDTTHNDSGADDNPTVPDAPVIIVGTEDIFDNTTVDTVVEEAKAAEEAKSNKSGGGALGFLTLLALPMAIRRRRSNE